jgi:hypothetical protein
MLHVGEHLDQQSFDLRLAALSGSSDNYRCICHILLPPKTKAGTQEISILLPASGISSQPKKVYLDLIEVAQK